MATATLDMNGFVELDSKLSAKGKVYLKSLGKGEIQVYETGHGPNRWVRAFVVNGLAQSSSAYPNLQTALLAD